MGRVITDETAQIHACKSFAVLKRIAIEIHDVFQSIYVFICIGNIFDEYKLRTTIKRIAVDCLNRRRQDKLRKICTFTESVFIDRLNGLGKSNICKRRTAIKSIRVDRIRRQLTEIDYAVAEFLAVSERILSDIVDRHLIERAQDAARIEGIGGDRRAAETIVELDRFQFCTVSKYAVFCACAAAGNSRSRITGSLRIQLNFCAVCGKGHRLKPRRHKGTVVDR